MLSFVVALLMSAAPDPGVKPDWILPAGAALATPEAVVLWAPDFRSVLGVDGAGKRLWRVATGDQGGLRDLERLGDAVLAYAGAEAILIAPKTGKVLGRQPEVRLGAPGVPGCRVVERGGACGVSCPCSFLPVRCEDLAPLAPRATLAMFEEWDVEGNRQSHCAGSAGTPIVRGGDVVVATLASATDARTMIAETALVGFDATAKKETWRAAELGGLAPSSIDPTLSGVTHDGRTCWVATRAGELRVFDCATGASRWSRRLQIPAGAEPQLEAVAPADGPPGLVVRDGVRAKRLDAQGGVVWDVALPANELFVSAATTTRGMEHRRFGKLVGARVLDLASGAERGALTFAKGSTRWPIAWPFEAGGWISVGDRDWQLLPTGAARPTAGRATAFIEELVAGPTLVALRTRAGVDVRGLHDDRSASFAGHLVVAVEGVAGSGRVILLRQGSGPWDPGDPATFGELRRYTIR
ncbi:MAG: PQQ-binding-like beta-propeller repeat protein [Deltaproteobacteria bacterium]|nr:PQQ-binding-like beta-propeller repeat protein [Deltaproteobacteria bacterium]